MARPRQFDEDDVLERAVSVFRERGFEFTSVPQLMSELGICRQSLYNTFGDKRGLYLKVLERWREREIETKLALLTGPGSAMENLRTVIRGMAALASTCPSEGCLTITGIVESHDDPEALALLETQVERLEQGFHDALDAARRAGELRADVAPERLSRALISSYYGVGLLASLPGSARRVADTVSVMLELLDSAATT